MRRLCIVAVTLPLLMSCGSTSDGPEPRAPTVEGWDHPPGIVAGRETTCVVLRDGGVACWGNGWDRRLGDGRGADSPHPVRVISLDGVVRLSGAQHTCALTDTGDIYCWGPYVPTGLVGEESHGDFPLPTLQPFIPAVDVDSGSNHVCGLARDGRVQCRSPAEEGPADLGVTTASRLARAGSVLCTLGTGGAIGCARRQGSRREGYSYVPEPPTNIDAVDLAFSPNPPRFLAVRRDGTVVARERFAEGWSTFAAVGRAMRLGGSAYGGHDCLVLADGGVTCWGANDEGQLGDGTRENRDEPVRVHGIDDAVAVAAGWNHSCAIRATGSVVCWGANHRGQLGDGTTEPSATPVAVRGLDLAGTPELTAEPPSAGLCLEEDGDGDGLGDRLERQPPYPCAHLHEAPDDGDGVPAEEDDDTDGDGLADAVEHEGHPCAVSARDCDGDRVPEHIDRDSDNDGVWDLDEGSLEAACTPDSDADGCDDLTEHVLGGCAAEHALAVFGRGYTRDASRTGEVTLVVGAGATDPSDVTLHVEDVVVLHEPVAVSVETRITGVSADGDAEADGPGFRGAVTGEALRFQVELVDDVGYFDGDTAVARAELVLRDDSGEALARGALLALYLPDGTCPGP